jgi:hypothetical protein
MCRSQGWRGIAKYIDVYYNHQRLHSSLEYVSPVDDERERRPARLAPEGIELQVTLAGLGPEALTDWYVSLLPEDFGTQHTFGDLRRFIRERKALHQGNSVNLRLSFATRLYGVQPGTYTVCANDSALWDPKQEVDQQAVPCATLTVSEKPPEQSFTLSVR